LSEGDSAGGNHRLVLSGEAKSLLKYRIWN